MVNAVTSQGPSYDAIRPFESAGGQPPQTGLFPVYDDLVDHLVKQESSPGHPDEITAHVLAVLATYAYSDLDTVLEMATRLGLPGIPAGRTLSRRGRSPGSRVITTAWPSRRAHPPVTRISRRSPLTVAGAAPALPVCTDAPYSLG